MSWVLFIAVTDPAKRHTPSNNCPKPFETPGVKKRLTQRSFFLILRQDSLSGMKNLIALLFSIAQCVKILSLGLNQLVKTVTNISQNLNI
jgi:hypothetical protein